jgi:hypothetical protein
VSECGWKFINNRLVEIPQLDGKMSDSWWERKVKIGKTEVSTKLKCLPMGLLGSTSSRHSFVRWVSVSGSLSTGQLNKPFEIRKPI